MPELLKSKHDISIPILKSIRVHHPNEWRCILMPGMTGPELDILPGKGVLKQNMHCIERAKGPWKFLQKAGYWVNSEPMDAYEGLRQISGEKVGLIYMDFMTQIGLEEYKTVAELFKWHINEGTKLLLTFGKNRTTREKAAFSRLFAQHGWGKPYPPVIPFLDDIIRLGNFIEYKDIKEHPYVSDKWHYVTVEADF